jgi:hypothetical protein
MTNKMTAYEGKLQHFCVTELLTEDLRPRGDCNSPQALFIAIRIFTLTSISTFT